MLIANTSYGLCAFFCDDTQNAVAQLQATYPQAQLRASSSALGSYLVTALIPSHRVIQQSGVLRGYRWGLPRKVAMLTWEAGNKESAQADDG